MPSAFPGMDPYLEDPPIWPDFHDRFANELSGVLNGLLPRPYYARLQTRPEVGIVGEGEGRRIVPDVSIVRPRRLPAPRPAARRRPQAGGVLTLERPARTQPTESLRVGYADEPIRHRYVEIRDSIRGHALVTLFEIVSPTNKRPGDDRRAYLLKQREVLDSDANLIEIDLLGAGEPVAAVPAVLAILRNAERDGRYLVSTSRAWERSPRTEFELYPFGLADPLPCISVPLREGEDEILLDLQDAFDLAYDLGPYARGAVEYSQPPDLRLADAERDWVRDRVAAAFEPIANAPEAGPPLSSEGGHE